MDKKTVLVLGNPDEAQFAGLAAISGHADVVIGESRTAVEKAMDHANVLFNWSGSRDFLREIFCRCPKLEWVHTRSAGLDTTFFPELSASNVVLTNGSGVFSEALAEFTLGAILYFARDFRRLVQNQMAGRWEQFDVPTLANRKVGIIGYGDIGRSVAAKLQPLGMKILAIKRHLPESADPMVERFFGPHEIREMISLCDYVVLSTPLTPETFHLIGEREIAAMKSDAVIVNVGRGPVIDEQFLINALAEKRIKGAALDVFEQEPLPDGHPFYSLENVLLSPHSADHTPEWLDDAVNFFVSQFKRFTSGEQLLNIVNKSLGY